MAVICSSQKLALNFCLVEILLQKYDTMFERNAKNGSFYLQSKVHRAKECLEAVYQKPDVPS